MTFWGAGGTGDQIRGQGSGARLGVGCRGQIGGNYPPTVWNETTLTSHQSGILHSLIFDHFARVQDHAALTDGSTTDLFLQVKGESH